MSKLKGNKNSEKRQYSGLSVFDLDHTLITVNGSIRFSKHLKQKRMVTNTILLRSTHYFFQFLFMNLPLKDLHEKMFNRILKGMSYPDMEREAKIFTDYYICKKWFEPAVEAMKNAKLKGHYTAILSSSPDFLVKPVADILGVDEWLSTSYRIDEEGKLDSLKCIVQGVDKATYALELAEKLGISNEDIYAYSDSHKDLPLLNISGHPHLVNPDRKLRSLQKGNGWPILT